MSWEHAFKKPTLEMSGMKPAVNSIYMSLLSAVTVSTTGLVTESQDTEGMRPAQTVPVS